MFRTTTLLDWLSLNLDTGFLLMKGFNVSFGVEGDSSFPLDYYNAFHNFVFLSQAKYWPLRVHK